MGQIDHFSYGTSLQIVCEDLKPDAEGNTVWNDDELHQIVKGRRKAISLLKAIQAKVSDDIRALQSACELERLPRQKKSWTN